MRLAIDIGNSKIACALLSPDGVVEVARFAREDVDALASALAWGGDRNPEAVAVTSVVPADLAVLKDRWRDRALLVVDHTTPFPFQVAVDSPETVGSDRYCNVAAAVALGADSAVVVDLGSANTYDVLRRGRFEGGLIAPGAGISHRALIQRGALLPEVILADPGTLVGRNTPQAIAAGSFHQAAAGIAGLIQCLVSELDGAPVFLTGGMAPLFLAAIAGPVDHRPLLTLEGAAGLLPADGPGSK